MLLKSHASWLLSLFAEVDRLSELPPQSSPLDGAYSH